MNHPFYDAVTWLLPLICAIVFHEVAHGLAARALGDTTAEERGRLSFNPLRHVDPVGTVLLPGFLALIKAPIFGWARPVTINPARLRNPRVGMMLVAAAGPAMNLLMAAIGALLLGRLLAAGGGVPAGWDALTARLEAMGGAAGFVGDNLINFILINVFLALFNLVPLPPFDGSHIVEGLLPAPFANVYRRVRQWGMLLPIVVLIVLPSLIPGFNLLRLLDPVVERVIGAYMALAQLAGG